MQQLVDAEIGDVLTACGLAETRAVESKSFGDSLVEFEGHEYKVRFVRDRGTTSVEIASQADPGNWNDLGRVLEAAGSTVRVPEPVDLKAIGQILGAEHPRLDRSMSGSVYPQTRAELERLGAKAQADLLKRLVPAANGATHHKT